jgi:hypothetical protein
VFNALQILVILPHFKRQAIDHVPNGLTLNETIDFTEKETTDPHLYFRADRKMIKVSLADILYMKV